LKKAYKIPAAIFLSSKNAGFKLEGMKFNYISWN